MIQTLALTTTLVTWVLDGLLRGSCSVEKEHHLPLSRLEHHLARMKFDSRVIHSISLFLANKGETTETKIKDTSFHWSECCPLLTLAHCVDLNGRKKTCRLQEENICFLSPFIFPCLSLLCCLLILDSGLQDWRVHQHERGDCVPLTINCNASTKKENSKMTPSNDNYPAPSFLSLWMEDL